jgi:uncharacterized SAM-binding protein YcdF (DUF218 family)
MPRNILSRLFTANRKGYRVRNVFIVLLALVAIAIAIISVYLTPNDLRGCSEVAREGNCQPADAIVAISGGNTQARAAEAIRLYKNGWAKTLIFSGAAADTSGPSNAEVMRRQAIKEGVPAEDVQVEPLSKTTKQNAERVKEILVTVGSGSAQSVILVTSPYHQRRASLEFGSLAGDGITVINRPVPNDPDWSTIWWLTPRGWWLAGGELAKIGAYYMGETR